MEIASANLQELAALRAQITARILELAAQEKTEPGTAVVEGPSRFLRAQEAAEVSGLSSRFFYDAAPRLPFTLRPSPRRLRFDEAGLREWMLSQTAIALGA